MGYRLKATSVHVARALYALNWFDVAPGLTAISKDLGLQLVQLGIATTFFYIGLSALQLVGGALASKIGSRKIAFIGLVVLGAGAIFSGLSTNLLELVVGRFIAGSGSALFFSPGLTLLRDISPPESYGLQVGIYNGAFNLGGAVGAFGWVFVDKALGWQTGLILGGILVIAVSIENLIVLRGQDEVKAESTGFYEKIFTILKNKYLWLLPIGTVIAMFVETVGAQFLVYFGENFLYLASSEAGLIDFVFLLIGFPAGIVAGHYISNPKTRRPYTYVTMIIGGLAFMLVPFGRTFALTTAIVALAGFTVVSGFSALYVLAVQHVREKSMIPFAISFVNFVGIAIGSVSPFLFTLFTHGIGPDYGWIILGAIGLALLPLFFISKSKEVPGS